MNIKRTFCRELLYYLLVSVISISFFSLASKIWTRDLNVPWSYSGDSFMTASQIKGYLEDGSFLINNKIGAPYGANFSDFPSSDTLFLGIISIISFFTKNWQVVLKLLFMISFPLTAITAFFVFRYFGRTAVVSVAGAVLFALLPYHFIRGINHLFLACYFTVPLGVLIAIELMNGNFILSFKDRKSTLKSLLFISSCILIGCSGIYYSFFSCFIISLAGIIGIIERKPLKKVAVCLIPLMLIFLTVTANLASSIIYTKNNGANAEVALRSPKESELYGLKITQLLLPVTGHKISFLAQVKNLYRNFPLVNENDSASLGIIGSSGFVILLIMLFAERNSNADNNLLKNLSDLNVGAVLLATIGGFSSVFAMLITSKIRAYNRISVFIAFFSILAVITLFDIFFDKFIRKARNFVAWLVIPTIIFVMVIGAADQIPNMGLAKDIKNEYFSDREFIQRIETVLPKDSMIFQLPYVPFPENPPVFRMGDYELFRGYLHSTKLRWSYGVIRGRPGDLVYRNICSMPVEKMLDAVSLYGYSGIYVDTFGFADEGNLISTDLQRLIGQKPLISENGRLLFFDLSKYNDKITLRYIGVNKEELKNKIAGLNRIKLIWQPGFCEEENNGNSKLCWCSQQGELLLINQFSKPKRVQISANIYSRAEEDSELLIYYKPTEDCVQLKLTSKRTPFRKAYLLSPGINRLKFSSWAQSAGSKDGDLRFVLEDFNVVETD